MASGYQSIIPDRAATIIMPFIIAFACMPLLVVGAAPPAEVVSEELAEDASVVVSGVVAVETKVDVVEDSSELLVTVDETVEVGVEEAAEDVVLSLMPHTFSTSKVNSMFLASHSSVCLWTESTL